MGGGYIGLELAQAMRRFGSRVTVIERNSRLVHREDEDVADALSNLFQDEGSELVLNAHVKKVSGKSGDSVEVVLTQNGAERTLQGTTFWSRLAELPTQKDSVWNWPAWSSQIEATSRSTSGSDNGARCLGDRRISRQSAVHAHCL